MAKEKCIYCGHKCHCVGQGYYVTSEDCSTCNCYICHHEKPLKLKKEVKKSLWQRYIDWLFKD